MPRLWVWKLASTSWHLWKTISGGLIYQLAESETGGSEQSMNVNLKGQDNVSDKNINYYMRVPYPLQHRNFHWSIFCISLWISGVNSSSSLVNRHSHRLYLLLPAKYAFRHIHSDVTCCIFVWIILKHAAFLSHSFFGSRMSYTDKSLAITNLYLNICFLAEAFFQSFFLNRLDTQRT